jgi:polysaccharide deacetylase family sporulation protein PdaB
MAKKFRILNITFIIIFLIVLGSSVKQINTKSIHTLANNEVKIISHGPKKEKVVALTFDDGPHPVYTTEILDLLNEYNIKATFFVLGKFAEQYPDIIKRQAEEQHEIGNHTYSHININKVSREKFEEEFDKTQKVISSLTGIESKVFRPPYGSCNEKTMKIVNTQECNVVLWSYRQDSKDWSNPDVDKIIDTTLSNVENGDIILFHDYVYYDKSNTVEALKVIIPELISRGYNFVTISELMQLPEI